MRQLLLNQFLRFLLGLFGRFGLFGFRLAVLSDFAVAGRIFVAVDADLPKFGISLVVLRAGDLRSVIPVTILGFGLFGR